MLNEMSKVQAYRENQSHKCCPQIYFLPFFVTAIYCIANSLISSTCRGKEGSKKDLGDFAHDW